MNVLHVDLITLLLLIFANALWFSLLGVLFAAPSAIFNLGQPSHLSLRRSAAAVLALDLVAAAGMSFWRNPGYAIITGGTAVICAVGLWGWVRSRARRSSKATSGQSGLAPPASPP